MNGYEIYITSLTCHFVKSNMPLVEFICGVDFEWNCEKL